MTLMLAAWLAFAPPVEAEGADGPSQELPTNVDVSIEAVELEPAPPVEPPPPPVKRTPPEKAGPPFYSEDDMNALRLRYGLDPIADHKPRKPKWRCLIADPACRVSFEVQGTSGYAYRLRQADVSQSNDVRQWNSAIAGYDAWLSIAAASEVVGRSRYARLTLGPKVGVTASDGGDVWGNFGMAARYWFGHGAWSPNIEFTTALNFSLARFDQRTDLIEPRRTPIGITADIGFGVGGFGAIVLGGQFETPLAREELPEAIRSSAAGMFFVAFRGNILWGVPLAGAITSHALANRLVER